MAAASDAFDAASSSVGAHAEEEESVGCRGDDETKDRRAIRGQMVNHGALWLAQLIWALMHVYSNRALEHIKPTAFCAFRLTLALPFLWYSARREGGEIPLSAWRWVLAMGVSIGAAYLMIFVCNRRVGATLTASVQPLLPVSVSVLSAAVGLEKFTRMKMLGVFVVFCGTVTALRAYQIFYAGGITVVDVLLLLSQTNSYSVYAVLLGLATKRWPYPLRFLFYATVVSAVGVSLIAIPTFKSTDFAAVPASAWGAVVFAGLASSVIAHSLNSWAIARIKGVLPTVYSGIQVIFTIILASIFLDERFDWDRGVGIVVTLSGVALVAKAKFAESHDETADVIRTTTHSVKTTNTTTPVASADNQI